MKNKKAILVLVCLGGLFLTGCPSSPPPLPPSTSGGGFFIETEFQSSTGPIFPIPVPNVTTHWDWQNDVSGFTAVGDASSFTNTTNLAGIGVVLNGRVPAIWIVQWLAGGPPNCIGAPDAPGLPFQSNPQRTTEVICFEQRILTGEQDFVFSPKPIYTDGSSGPTATIRGQGFSSQYGMPMVQYVDSSGTLIAQVNMTAVASDGTWATAPMPDVSQVIPGSYSGVVYNANANGGFDFLGIASATVLDPPVTNGGCTGRPRPINCN